MPPELWPLIGIAVSVAGSYAAVRLQIRAQNRKTDAEREVNAGELALGYAKEAKSESTAAKVEAREAHREAQAAKRALHETRAWYIADHLPYDQAVMDVLLRLDPDAPEKLPPRKDPPLWPKGL
jgi:hypothetical protein